MSSEARNTVRRFLMYQKDQLLEAQPQKFFNFVFKQLHPSNNNILLHSPTGLTSDLGNTCTMFSNEFAKNFSNSSFIAVMNGDSLSCTSERLCMINIDLFTVRMALTQLSDSAAGPDGLPDIFFKKRAYWIAVLLKIVYQQSIHLACIPDDWRQMKVIALYTGKGHNASSYRPINLTAVVSQVLEFIVVQQLRDFLISNNLICKEQHGFIPNRSTTTNLLQCDVFIADHLNANETCDVLLLDFSRAFDKVSHNILIAKLPSFGISGKLLACFANFLCNSQTQFVSYNGAVSTPVSLTSGVVQGFVVGPQLLTMMIKDLPKCVVAMRIVLYADDGKVVSKTSSLQD